MTRVCIALAAWLTLFAAVSPAWAQVHRAWVSGHGTDAPGCGAPTAPCRSLQYVHDHIIAAGGEIDVLDPAGYGAVAITKALSIVNDGVGLAGVQQSLAGQNAISINAGASDAITLKGLTIDGVGVAQHGIAFAAGGSLSVRDSTIQSFTGNGIDITSAASTVLVSDTSISDVTAEGINFAPSAAATLMVERTQIYRAGNIGVLLEGDHAAAGVVVSATISDSVLASNFRAVFGDGAANTAQPTGYIVNTVIANSTSIGIVSSDTKLFLAHSTLVNSKTDGFFLQAAGTLSSFGDNNIADATNSGSLTPIAQR